MLCPTKIHAHEIKADPYQYEDNTGIHIINLNELEDNDNESFDYSNEYDEDYTDEDYLHTETEKEKSKREAEEKLKAQEKAEKQRLEEKKRAKKLAQKRKPIIAFAKKITKNINNKKDKLKAIHDTICRHADYDWKGYKEGGGTFFEGDEGSYEYENSVVENALSMLKTKKGFCGHYASLFTECCRAINIESEVVGNDDHAWSEVKLDGKKYVVDVTLDDNKNISHNYFMIKEHPMIKAAKIKEKYLKETKLPKYQEKFSKIDKMNIKNENEFFQVMSYINHMLKKGKSFHKLKLRVVDKKFNGYKHLNSVFLLSWYSVSYGYDYKTRTYTFSFNY